MTSSGKSKETSLKSTKLIDLIFLNSNLILTVHEYKLSRLERSSSPAGLGQKSPLPSLHCCYFIGFPPFRYFLVDVGVALAEILMDKLPKGYHNLFLPNIEIYNLTPQRSIVNLKVILDTLTTLCSERPEVASVLTDFTPEGLYFDHNMMEEFIVSVMKSLEYFIPSDEPRR